jgi:hypothetical protein
VVLDKDTLLCGWSQRVLVNGEVEVGRPEIARVMIHDVANPEQVSANMCGQPSFRCDSGNSSALSSTTTLMTVRVNFWRIYLVLPDGECDHYSLRNTCDQSTGTKAWRALHRTLHEDMSCRQVPSLISPAHRHSYCSIKTFFSFQTPDPSHLAITKLQSVHRRPVFSPITRRSPSAPPHRSCRSRPQADPVCTWDGIWYSDSQREL